LIDRWPGPLGVSFYLPKNAEQASSLVQIEAAMSTVIAKRAAINGPTIRYTLLLGVEDEPYPVNVLRNHAVRLSSTEFVLTADIDFLPSITLWKNFMSKYDHYSRLSKDTVFVVPAFASSQKKFELIPHTKNEIISAWRASTISWNTDKIRPHHIPTLYEKWFTATSDYPIVYRFWYEPYTILNVQNVPDYDERWKYYGFDKVQYNLELARMGYKFLVLGQDFIIHVAHDINPWVGVAQTLENELKNMINYYISNFGQ